MKIRTLATAGTLTAGIALIGVLAPAWHLPQLRSSNRNMAGSVCRSRMRKPRHWRRARFLMRLRTSFQVR